MYGITVAAAAHFWYDRFLAKEPVAAIVDKIKAMFEPEKEIVSKLKERMKKPE